jgi:hypothetical protein
MVSLGHTIALLERTPGALDSLLRGLPDVWKTRSEGKKTWSAVDVLGHLIHCEADDWMPRARRILAEGESRAFDAFDRWGHVRMVEGQSMAELLDEFMARRGENLTELRGWNLSMADSERRGLHPVLGQVTLGHLLVSWGAHDLNHLHQMARLMAHQYREAVGPFAAFMGVMRCDAHGG